MRDVARLRRIPNVAAVAPVVSLAKIPAYFRTAEWQPGLAGIDHNYWKTQTPHVLSGRLISASDVVGRRQVCVLGKDVVKYLFGGSDPVGQVIHVGNLTFEVIGILGGIQHTNIRTRYSYRLPRLRASSKVFTGSGIFTCGSMTGTAWNRSESRSSKR